MFVLKVQHPHLPHREGKQRDRGEGEGGARQEEERGQKGGGKGQKGGNAEQERQEEGCRRRQRRRRHARVLWRIQEEKQEVKRRKELGSHL